MLAKETELHKAQSQFEEMIGFVQECVDGKERIDRVERGLMDRLLKLGHCLLQRFVQSHGDGDNGATLSRAGRQYRRLPRLYRRRYVSIFGELNILRTVYGTRPTQKIEAVPLDATLGLPEGDRSHVLQDWEQRFCVQGSYGKAVESLATLLNLKVSVGSAEADTARMAASAEAYRIGQSPPTGVEEGDLFVVTADGKGVVMRKPDQPSTAEDVSASSGKKGTKRMAYVGAVYSVDRFVRSVDDVMDELKRRRRQRARPQPIAKRVWAEMTRLNEEEQLNGRAVLFGQMGDELDERNVGGAKEVVCLMDGERALWTQQKVFAPAAMQILDLFHATERLWSAAHIFHASGGDAAQAFVDKRLRMLLEGKVGRVIGGFRQMLTKHKLTGQRRQQLQKVIGYYENNRHRMCYDQYLSAGYPIGSGVAEGACRHLVKDRMEQTGMRWRQTNAQAVLHLRAIYLNGDWDDFIERRIQNEQQRHYGKIAA